MAKTVRTSGAYTLQPTSEVVTLKNGLLFTPVAFANLPGTPAMGMVAFLTTDGAGATKNKPIGLIFITFTYKKKSYTFKKKLYGSRSKIQKDAVDLCFKEIKKLI